MKPKTKAAAKKYIGAKVPAEHAEALARLAKEQDVTVSQLFRKIVRQLVGAENA